ncbi:hypothetical protein H6503_06990 [Candidatus Woesearchaeota archaeon]|nr:hypothetical protein [Candidatus Woesearchaeota archaeon]
MSRTGKSFKDLGDALSEDAQELGQKAGHSTLDGIARLRGEVNKRGGLTGILSSATTGTAKWIGRQWGRGTKHVSAAYKAMTEVNYTDREFADSVFEALKRDYDANIASSEVDPEMAAQQFERIAQRGIGLLGYLRKKAVDGKDDFSDALQRHIPKDEDYVLEYGRHKIPVTGNALTVTRINEIKEYVTEVLDRLPSNYAGKIDIGRMLASEGIRTDAMFKDMKPDVYNSIERHLVD